MINARTAILCAVFAVFGVALLIVGFGLSFRASWANAFWPWPYGGLSFLFVGSVFCALGSGSLVVALIRDWRSAAGGSLTFIIAGLGSAIYLVWFGQTAGPGYAIVCILLAVGGVLLLWLALATPPRDPRRPPALVVWSCWIFAAGLFGAGLLLIARFPNIFPWQLPPDTSSIYGFMFAGLAANYAFIAARGHWGDAIVSLIAFLVYDLVLIGPFASHFSTVEPARLPSLVTYMAALIYSGVISVWFLSIAAREPFFPAKTA